MVALKTLLALFALAWQLGIVAHAADESRNLQPNAAAGGSEKRVALVIGNAAYPQGPLKNPVNDARAMAGKLRTLGFDVIVKENLKQREIGGVYREFRTKIAPGGTALVFYAGHGLQVKGQNYFPAVDSTIDAEEDVPLQSLNLGTLLENMEEAKASVSLVMLDACRDNPFARRFRSASRGLAKVEAASGTLIHYATKPGSVAADGEGKNGTYTEALLAQMSEPGVPVELMLKKVANQVVEKTKGKQEPWIEGSLRGEFYFIFKGPTSVTVQSTGADAESIAWQAAERANTEAAYRTYLDGYPEGKYSVAARITLDALKNKLVDKPVEASKPFVPQTLEPKNPLVAIGGGKGRIQWYVDSSSILRDEIYTIATVIQESYDSRELTLGGKSVNGIKTIHQKIAIDCSSLHFVFPESTFMDERKNILYSTSAPRTQWVGRLRPLRDQSDSLKGVLSFICNR